MNASGRLILSSAAAIGTVLFLAAGQPGLSAGSQDQEKGKGGATVEERLDRIERLLRDLVEQGKAEGRMAASSSRAGPQGRPFRRPDSIPKRELRSTRVSPQTVAPGTAPFPEAAAAKVA